MKLLVPALLCLMIGCASEPTASHYTGPGPDAATYRSWEEANQETERRRALALSVRDEDRRRWYEFYLNAGYTPEQAKYKADEIMLPHFYR